MGAAAPGQNRLNVVQELLAAVVNDIVGHTSLLLHAPGLAQARLHSKTLAAITATMPVTIPLALWIVYSGSSGDRATVVQFVEALFVTMVANLFFVLATWLAARSR